MRAVAVAIVSLVTFGCGHPAAPSPVATPSFSSQASTHFTFRFTAMDAGNILQIANAMEAEFSRITSDLDVASMPMVTVTFYPSSEVFRQSVVSFSGPLPQFAAGLVSGADGIHMVSPNQSAVWSFADGVQATIHEFAHCVSLRVNPSFANNPRWLWESVALYEAGQFTDPRTVAGSSTLTSFTTLNSFDNTMIYGIGGSLARFVIDTRGRDAFRALIRANGDLTRVLEMSDAAFLTEWVAYFQRAG